jgi:TPR repeat protein
MICCGNWVHQECAKPSNIKEEHCPLCKSPRMEEFGQPMIDKLKHWVAHDKAWAMDQLGNCYLHGSGVMQSSTLAKELWEQAAEKGHRFSLVRLGLMHLKGQGNIEQSFEQAAKYFQLASDQGDDTAQLQLGKLYMDGLGVEQSLEKSHFFYDLSCQSGNQKALYVFGMKQLSGEGFPFPSPIACRRLLMQITEPRLKEHCAQPLNYVTALIETQYGAANGVAEKQFKLGSDFGKGAAGLGAKSMPTAMFWYTKAVAQGFGQAIPMLALCATTMEASGDIAIPDDSTFCSLCASLTPRRIIPAESTIKHGFLNCKCKRALYCSKACQSEHWKKHRKEHKRVCKEKEKEKK